MSFVIQCNVGKHLFIHRTSCSIHFLVSDHHTGRMYSDHGVQAVLVSRMVILLTYRVFTHELVSPGWRLSVGWVMART